LNEFFSGRYGKKADLTARHYGFSRTLEAPEQDDIHKYLAHITTRRGTKKDWRGVLSQKLPLAFGIVADFLDQALPDYKPDDWTAEHAEVTVRTYRELSGKM